jgi:hypothetical protein
MFALLIINYYSTSKFSFIDAYINAVLPSISFVSISIPFFNKNFKSYTFPIREAYIN